MKNIVSEIHFILLGLLLLVVTSCRHGSPADSLLASADAVMHTHPDSALLLLEQVPHPEKLQGEQQALYALLFTQASYKNGIPVESDSLISMACDYYASSSDSMRKAWSCFYAAQVYRDMSMPRKALEYFHMADNASRGTDDYRLSSLINYHWGNLLGKQKMYDDNIKLLNNSLESNINRQDTFGILFCLSQLGWTYILKDKTDSAEIILEKGIDLLENYRPCIQAVDIYQQMAIVCNKQKRQNDALLFINKGIKANGGDSPQLSITKGNIFLDMQQYDSAAYYFSKDTRYGENWEKRGHHLIWAKFYEKKGDYRKASENWKMASLLADTIEVNNRTEEIARIQKRYDYTVIKHENDRLKLQQLQNRFWMVVLCGSLLVAVAVAYIIYLGYMRYRRNRDEMLRSRDELLRQLRLELREKSLVLERVESERAVAGVTSADSLRAENESLRTAMLRASDVMRRVESLQSGGTGSLTSAEMSDLADTLDVCFDGFCRRLKSDFPSLNASDLAYCCLVRLGVPSYSILHLLDVSKETLKRRKTRMKHDKMHLPEDVSLDEYIRTRK